MSDSEDWMKDALCLGMDTNAFFPVVGWDATTIAKFCIDCPVRTDCLDYALVNRIDHGVWGGKTERQRRNLLRTRRHVCYDDSMEPEPPVQRKVM